MVSSQNVEWIEGDLSFDFSKASKVINFDHSGKGHRFTHNKACAVDFILEDEHRYYFIEVKDPENPKIPDKYKEKNKEEFLSKNLTEEFRNKFEDSLVFQSMEEGIPAKRFLYVVLLCLNSTSDQIHLQTLKEKLLSENIQKYPLKGNWKKGFDTVFVNLEQWNKYFSQYPVLRLSETKK